MNRHFFREAVRKRYHQSKLSSSLANSLNEYRIAADAQEVRLNMIRFGEATTLREKSLMEEDDEDDCQWLSDQEEASETSSVEEEEDQVEEDSVKVHFGSVVVEANEGLFSKFSGSDEGLGDNRKSTMDMNELVKMLRWVDILPQHLTKVIFPSSLPSPVPASSGAFRCFSPSLMHCCYQECDVGNCCSLNLWEGSICFDECFASVADRDRESIPRCKP